MFTTNTKTKDDHMLKVANIVLTFPQGCSDSGKFKDKLD